MLHSGPAGQLEFESNRLAIYNIKAKKIRSFLRQAHNQITIRYKRQALYNNKRTKVWLVCYRFLIQPPRACMRVYASAIINTLNKLTLSAKKVGGQLPPLPPPAPRALNLPATTGPVKLSSPTTPTCFAFLVYLVMS